MLVGLPYRLLVIRARALDQWFLSIKLIFFTFTVPHIKSKGLSIGSPLASNVYFLYAQRHIQKIGGSQSVVP
jgi:hypothetical protein